MVTPIRTANRGQKYIYAVLYAVPVLFYRQVMISRKGEMRSHHIDRWWPYQVALVEAITVGRANDVVRAFCKDLSLSPRGHTFRRNDQWFNVWCFAEEEHALKFIARFGGERIAVEDRPRWPGKMRKP